MARDHPELVIAYMKAMIKVGRWANREQACCRSDPQPADLLPGCRGYVPGYQARRHGAEPECAEPGMHQDRQGLHAAATATSRMTSTWTSGRHRNSWRRRHSKCSRRNGRGRSWSKLPAGRRARRRGHTARIIIESTGRRMMVQCTDAPVGRMTRDPERRQS